MTIIRKIQNIEINIGVNMMNRRKFLKLIVLGGIFSLFSRKVEAERKPEQKLKEAMFWRKLDNE